MRTDVYTLFLSTPCKNENCTFCCNAEGNAHDIQNHTPIIDGILLQLEPKK